MTGTGLHVMSCDWYADKGIQKKEADPEANRISRCRRGISERMVPKRKRRKR